MPGGVENAGVDVDVGVDGVVVVVVDVLKQRYERKVEDRPLLRNAKHLSTCMYLYAANSEWRCRPAGWGNV